MEEIKSVILGVCISLLLIGFFLKLLPKGSISKNMRHVLSMVVLLIIITPLSKEFDINWESFGLGNDETVQYSESDYKNRVVQSVVSMLEDDVRAYLDKQKFGYYSVRIETTEEEEGVELKEIVVYIKSGYDPSKVEKSVADEFDLPCKVIIGAE